MELDKVITLIHAVSESRLTGFSLEEGNMKLRLEKQNGSMQVLTRAEEDGASEQEAAIWEEKILHSAKAEAGSGSSTGAEGTEADYAMAQNEETENAGRELKGEELKSPLVGTFYASSSPDAEPFVRVGDQVKKGQVLGIIEAMKLMNEIEAEKDGVIEAVLAENEQMVEYGQPLFSIV